VGIAALVGVFSVGCSVFGIRSEEQPIYEVLRTDGNKEIRRYSSYLVATTRSEGDYEHASTRGFWRLFDYISGNNSSQAHIAMTAPVLQEQAAAGEKIAMTAPVLQEQDAQGWTMSFVLPAKYTMQTVPRPLHDNVTLHEVPAAHVAVLRYSWGTSAEKITRLRHELLTWLATQNRYEVVSAPRSARYDPPFTLPFFRRNEIHVDVRLQPRSDQSWERTSTKS
jgi:DNA gyrase inhibitor GyrI